MKTLYLDIFSGISGDMFIGAMLDLGVDFHQLEHELKKLHLDGYHLHSARKQKAQIEGVKFDVHLAHEHDHDYHHNHDHGHEHTHEHTHADGTKHSHVHSHARGHEHHHHHEHHHDEHEHGKNFSEIKTLIRNSALSDWVKEKSVAVFQRIAVAEGKIHGMPPDEVHFHEVGAVDSIVDIVGACVALEMLGKPKVLAGNVVEGTGWIRCAHGRFPIPAPASLAIFAERKIPITQCDEPHELVTPTGAALLAEFVESFGSMQNLAPARIGFGLGTRDNKTRPNVLRAILGETGSETFDWEADTICVLETNLDDATPEIIGHVSEKAFASGALDVFLTPIQMKKNRPGVLLTILCGVADADKFTAMLLSETSAFGVRRSTLERRKLHREFETVKTEFGEVAVKFGKLNGNIVQASPEYESCRKLADSKNVPLKKIYEAVTKAANR